MISTNNHYFPIIFCNVSIETTNQNEISLSLYLFMSISAKTANYLETYDINLDAHEIIEIHSLLKFYSNNYELTYNYNYYHNPYYSRSGTSDTFKNTTITTTTTKLYFQSRSISISI